jgi:hypothetical protein
MCTVQFSPHWPYSYTILYTVFLFKCVEHIEISLKVTTISDTVIEHLSTCITVSCLVLSEMRKFTNNFF